MNQIDTTTQSHERRPIIIIYSMRMAGFLMQRGFYLVSCQPNKKQPDRKCYTFFDTPMLKEAMAYYLENHPTV